MGILKAHLPAFGSGELTRYDQIKKCCLRSVMECISQEQHGPGKTPQTKILQTSVTITRLSYHVNAESFSYLPHCLTFCSKTRPV